MQTSQNVLRTISALMLVLAVQCTTGVEGENGPGGEMEGEENGVEQQFGGENEEDDEDEEGED